LLTAAHPVSRTALPALHGAAVRWGGAVELPWGELVHVKLGRVVLTLRAKQWEQRRLGIHSLGIQNCSRSIMAFAQQSIRHHQAAGDTHATEHASSTHSLPPDSQPGSPPGSPHRISRTIPRSSPSLRGVCIPMLFRRAKIQPLTRRHRPTPLPSPLPQVTVETADGRLDDEQLDRRRSDNERIDDEQFFDELPHLESLGGPTATTLDTTLGMGSMEGTSCPEIAGPRAERIVEPGQGGVHLMHHVDDPLWRTNTSTSTAELPLAPGMLA
jgi:hypothetical protein